MEVAGARGGARPTVRKLGMLSHAFRHTGTRHWLAPAAPGARCQHTSRLKSAENAKRANTPGFRPALFMVRFFCTLMRLFVICNESKQSNN